MSTKDGIYGNVRSLPLPHLWLCVILGLCYACGSFPILYGQPGFNFNWLLGLDRTKQTSPWLFLLLPVYILCKHICILPDYSPESHQDFICQSKVFFCVFLMTHLVSHLCLSNWWQKTDSVCQAGHMHRSLQMMQFPLFLYRLSLLTRLSLHVFLTDDQGEDMSPKQAWHI